MIHDSNTPTKIGIVIMFGIQTRIDFFFFVCILFLLISQVF